MADSEIPANIRIGAIDRLSKVLDKVKNKFPELSKSVGRAQVTFGLLQKSSEGFSKSLEKTGEKFKSFGETATLAITAPVIAARAYSIKVFSDIESALADVKVSTHLSGEELKVFGERISNVSKKIPVSQEELLKLAAAAGEAGVRGVDDLEKFSTTLAMLGKTAGINGEEAADGIVKMLNLTGEGTGKIQNFGSAVTALGEKYKVSGKNIIDNSQTIAREVAKFGVSSSQVLALATAVEPLGFNSKAAGIAVAEGFRGIGEAISKGGVHMKALSIITGQTGEELKKQFKDNPQVVFQEFLGGLEKIKKNGGSTADALKFFGASGDKTATILEALAKKGDGLNDIFKTSAEEFAKNTALTEDYAVTTETFESKMKILHNTTQALAAHVGAKLTPSVSFFIDLLTKGINFLDGHPALTSFLATVGGIASVIGPAAIGIGQFIAWFPKLIAGYEALVAVKTALAAVEWAAYIPVLLTVGLYVAIGVAIIALVAIIWHFRDAIMGGIVKAFDFVIEKVQYVIDLFKHAGGALAKFMGFGGNKLDIGVETPNGVLQPGGAGLAPQGADLGGAQASSQMNGDFSTMTNNARVDINVRAPQSTTVVAEGGNDFMSINRGLVGAH